MFKILLSPYLPLPGKYSELVISAAGDVLIINGDRIDLTSLPEGGHLPADAIGSDHFVSGSTVERCDGAIHVHLMFPISDDATDAARFPEPLIVTTDGSVALPK